MSDELSPTDDMTATGPIPAVEPDPDALQTFPVIEYEPDPEGLVDPAPQGPAVPGPELTQEVPAASDMTPRQALVADAKNRSWRTLLQGAVVAVLGSVALVVATYLKNGDATSVDWHALLMTVLMAAGTSAVSFLHKMLGSDE